MKIIKGIALTLVSFILFLSLCVFGIAYTVNKIALNPDYIEKTINNIDFSQVIQEKIDNQNSSNKMSPELEAAVVASVNNAQPVIKQQVDIAIEQTYTYLKEQGTTPDLKATLSNSVMTTAFVSALLDKIDLSQLLNQAVQEQIGTGADYSPAFVNALVNAVQQTEPEINTQIVNASGPIFQYLLMQTPDLDLTSTLRQTVLSDSSVSEILNNFDFNTLTKNIMTVYIGGLLPQGITLSDAQIDLVVNALQPSIKTALTSASGSFADYLTGTSPSFSVEVALAPAMPTLKTVTQEAFMAQLPAGLQGSSQTDINNAFEQYYTNFSQTIPATYNVNSSDIGIGGNTNITDAITKAQNNLTTARNNINTASQDFTNNLQSARPLVEHFNILFIGLIALIVLLILGIILIYRNVKGSCLNLGIVFFIYGALMFAGVLIAKSIASAQITKASNPQTVINTLKIVLNDVTSPLQIISLVCLIGGIVLLVASFVYPRLKKEKTTQIKSDNA
ncbi:MAG: hypothetical protein ACLPVI_03755 [Dehalococcoidales bacterium]